MNLHRTSGQPDWAHVAPQKRNYFQRTAAATGGLVTPANCLTAAGLALVAWGLVAVLQHQYWLGLGLLVVGRLLDILDGVAADATGTKSPLGELLDAAADKIGTIATAIVLFIVTAAPWWVLVLLLAPQVIIPFVSYYKKRAGTPLHPTRQGKLSMATLWVGIAGLLVLKELVNQPLLTGITYGVVAVSFGLGVYALWQYVTGSDS